MKRTELSRGTSQLKRTAMKASHKAPELRRQTLKSKGPRMTPIRRAARGEDCTLIIAGVCNFNPETTVLCHSPFLESGRGMGLKAPDTEAVFGCSACHDVLDGRRPLPGWMTRLVLLAVFERARTITHEKLKLNGLMK